MAKLAEEIWKTIVFSLILVTGVLSVLHYLEKDNWWKFESPGDSTRETPLVYYFIRGEENGPQTTADLFIRNNIQEKKVGSSGVFENLLPGQSFSVRINSGNCTIRTPSYILEDREIKLLTFERMGEEIVFVKSFSRKRKVDFPKAISFEAQDNLLSKIEKTIVENYKPMEEAKAKETKNVISVPEKKKYSDNYLVRRKEILFRIFNF